MLGEKVTAMDGNLAVDSTLEPMVLLRAAYEDGAEAVVETMGRFPDNPEVQVCGLIVVGFLLETIRNYSRFFFFLFFL